MIIYLVSKWCQVVSDGYSELLPFAAVAPAEWGDWGPWSKCMVCYRGKGLKARARTCYDPDSLGNEGCPGSPTETKNCEFEECTGIVI